MQGGGGMWVEGERWGGVGWGFRPLSTTGCQVILTLVLVAEAADSFGTYLVAREEDARDNGQGAALMPLKLIFLM